MDYATSNKSKNKLTHIVLYVYYKISSDKILKVPFMKICDIDYPNYNSVIGINIFDGDEYQLIGKIIKKKSLTKIKYRILDRDNMYSFKFTRKKSQKRKNTLSSFEFKVPSTQTIIDIITYTVIDDQECLKADMSSIISS